MHEELSAYRSSCSVEAAFAPALNSAIGGVLSGKSTLEALTNNIHLALEALGGLVAAIEAMEENIRSVTRRLKQSEVIAFSAADRTSPELNQYLSCGDAGDRGVIFRTHGKTRKATIHFKDSKGNG